MTRYNKAIAPLVTGIFLALAAAGVIGDDETEQLTSSFVVLVTTAINVVATFFAPSNR